MSGSKRRSPYRKVVTDGVLYGTPDLSSGHRVAVVVRSHGSNLLEVQVAGSGEAGLALLPSKFRKLIWIKRGDYVLVSEAAGGFETADGGAGRVRLLIETVLYPDAIRGLQRAGTWPAEFAAAAAGASRGPSSGAARGLPPGEEGEAGGAVGAGGGGEEEQDDGGSGGEGEEGEGEEGEEGEEDDDEGWLTVTDKWGNDTRVRRESPSGDAAAEGSAAQAEGGHGALQAGGGAPPPGVG